jgi:hypothetical protein
LDELPAADRARLQITKSMGAFVSNFSASEQAKGRCQDESARKNARPTSVARDEEAPRFASFKDSDAISKSLTQGETFCVVEVWDELTLSYQNAVAGSSLSPDKMKILETEIDDAVRKDTEGNGETDDELKAKHLGRCALMVMTVAGRTLRCSFCP